MYAGRSLRAPLIVLSAFMCLGLLLGVSWSAESRDVARAGALLAVPALLLSFRSAPIGTAACMVASGLLLAATIELPVTPSSNSFPASVRGRLEGTVKRIVSRSRTTSSLIIDGELDRQDLPAMRARALVRIRLRATPPQSVGTRVVVVGTFRAIDHSDALSNERALARSQHVQWIGTATMNEVSMLDDAPWYEDLRESARSMLFGGIERVILHDEHRALMRALILGDDTQIPRDVERSYTRTGTVHMLCVSGAHIALISSILLVLTTWIRLPGLRAACCCLGICAFVLLTGAEPPAMRAGLTGILAVTGLAMRRHVLAVNIFGGSVLVMVITAPEFILSYSFLLSAIATAALLFAVPYVRHAIDRLFLVRTMRQRLIADLCALNVSVSLLMSVPVYAWFGTVSPWAPLANLLVVPILTAGMVTGSIALCCVTIHPALGLYAGGTCELMLTLSNGIVDFFDAWSPTTVTGLRAVPCMLICTLGLLWICASPRPLAARNRTVIITVMCLFILLVPLRPPRRAMSIVSREWCVAIAVPLQTGTLVVVQDRRPHQQPWPDRSLSAWIASHSQPITVATTGPASIAVSDDVRAAIPITVHPIRQRELLYFHRIARLPKFASQL